MKSRSETKIILYCLKFAQNKIQEKIVTCSDIFNIVEYDDLKLINH